MLTRAKANMHISVKQKKKKTELNGPDLHRAAQHSAETARGRRARAGTGAFEEGRQCADRRLCCLLLPRVLSLSAVPRTNTWRGRGFAHLGHSPSKGGGLGGLLARGSTRWRGRRCWGCTGTAAARRSSVRFPTTASTYLQPNTHENMSTRFPRVRGAQTS